MNLNKAILQPMNVQAMHTCNYDRLDQVLCFCLPNLLHGSTNDETRKNKNVSLPINKSFSVPLKKTNPFLKKELLPDRNYCG